MENNTGNIKLFENTALVGVLLGILTLLTAVGYVFITMPAERTRVIQNITEKHDFPLQGEKRRPAVELHIPAERESFFVGDKVSIPIEISSGDVAVVGLDLAVSYPVDLLDFVEIEKGAAFGQLLKEVNAEKGEVYVSALAKPTKVFKGTGNLAKIVFDVRAVGEGKISFLEGDRSLVASTDPDAEFRTSFYDLTFEVKEATKAAHPSL